MSILEESADILLHPVTALWTIFGVVCSFILFFITQPNPISFLYLAFGVVSGFGFLFQPTVFKDCQESSVDWDEETEHPKVGVGLLVGLLGLATASFVIGVWSVGFDISKLLTVEHSVLWVPRARELYSVSEDPTAVASLYSFAVALFATLFSVIPGEENLKILFTPIFRAYEDEDRLANLHFALQPAIVIGVANWSVMHTVLGQHAPMFFFTVLFSGLVMMWMSAYSGTYLTSWLIHTAWNVSILVASFILSGQLTLVVA